MKRSRFSEETISSILRDAENGNPMKAEVVGRNGTSQGRQGAGRKEFHWDFETTLTSTHLPERPDYEAANRFLIKARRSMVNMTPTSEL